jgi:hypothetical protein
MASYLPLKRRRSVQGFLRNTLAIRRQLASADGLVGYGLDADLAKAAFWTLSVWKTQEHLDAFALSDPHRTIIERLRPMMGQTRFEFSSVSADQLPATLEPRKALR